MRKLSIFILFTNGRYFGLSSSSLIFLLLIIQPMPVHSQPALDPNLVLSLRGGHSETCIPTVTSQLIATGLNSLTSEARSYCDCIGIFYFNDLTRAEYDEMIASGGMLPARIAENRRSIQEHCAGMHFD